MCAVRLIRAVISYENFDLRLQTDGEGLAVFARLGSQTACETFALDPTLPFAFEDLDLSDREVVERSGKALFDALIPGKVRDLYQQGRGRIGRNSAKGLRLRICIDPRDERLRPLVRLPWELLYDRNADANLFLALDAQRPVVRTIDSSEPPLIPADTRLRHVLLALANPQGSDPLELKRECSRVETALKRKGVRPAIVRRAARLPLHQLICESEPEIVHFMGHGDADGDHGEGVLVLEDEDGHEDTLDASTFASFFLGRPAPRLVILTSCRTAVPGGDDPFRPFSSVAAALVAAGLPAVIAMQSEVRDANAILFTERLYGGLLRNEPVEAAVAEARVALRGVDSVTLDWAAPVLFVRSDEGPSVQVPFDPPAPPPTDAQHNDVTVTSGGVMVIGNHTTINQTYGDSK